MARGRPVVGDFDGDIFRLSLADGPLLDDLTKLSDSPARLEMYRFGGTNAVPVPGADTRFFRTPEEIEGNDAFLLLGWGDDPPTGCAPGPPAAPCGVVLMLDWLTEPGMSAFVIDANADGRRDLLACPADIDGAFGGPVDCWLLDDLDAFLAQEPGR